MATTIRRLPRRGMFRPNVRLNVSRVRDMRPRRGSTMNLQRRRGMMRSRLRRY